MFVTVEEVETCAARREQHSVAFGGQLAACGDSVVERVGVADGGNFDGEKVEQFGVVLAHADDGFYLFADERQNFRVIVALVFAAENEDGVFRAVLKGIPARVDVCGFGIVDVTYAVDGRDIFKTVLYAFEMQPKDLPPSNCRGCEGPKGQGRRGACSPTFFRR